MTWKYAWRYRWRVFRETLATSTFWWAFVGVLGALVVWFYLFYLAIKHLDTSLALHSTFCSNDRDRNIHILVIVLTTPLFIVGMIGVIAEWLAIMDNRRVGRPSRYRDLVMFSILMQLAAVVILQALQC